MTREGQMASEREAEAGPRCVWLTEDLATIIFNALAARPENERTHTASDFWRRYRDAPADATEAVAVALALCFTDDTTFGTQADAALRALGWPGAGS